MNPDSLKIPTFAQILSGEILKNTTLLKDAILRDRAFQSAKLSGTIPTTAAQNGDGQNRHQISSLKLLISLQKRQLDAEIEHPTDDSEPLLSAVLE